MSKISKMCCVCRLNTPNLIDLKYKDEAIDILNKLKEFIDLNALEYDPQLKFICLPCHDTLDVAYDFKQNCDKSMAASRLKIAKLVFKCKTCPMAFETANELEKHIVTHSIDLTEDDQPDVAPPELAGPKNGKSKSKKQLIIGGSKIRFKIPMRSSKKQIGISKKSKNSAKKETNHNSTSQHSSASQNFGK